MKIVIAAGTGQIGGLARRALVARGHEVVVLSRTPRASEVRAVREVAWDAQTLGPWADELDGADVVINLAGRSVNCRTTEANLREMRESRVRSTRVVGEAIARAERPPRVWLQMSTATIYAHRFDAPNDEATGALGGDEPHVPAYWANSVEIAKAWEAALAEAETPRTRKVALRTAMVMSPDRGGVFDVLLGLVRAGVGGSVAGGAQYVSWIHEDDFVAALVFLIENDQLEGAFNLAAPHPLPQREHMAALRDAWGRRLGLPATAWMAEVGAFVLRTDTELLLKSRRVVPKRLLDAGFRFEHPSWPEAARDLVARWRDARAKRGGAPPAPRSSADTSRGAALKGAALAVVAHAVFCVGFVALAHRMGGPDPESSAALGVLMAGALLPTSLAGAGLGCLARRLRRARVLALALAGMVAIVGVFAATFGLFGLSLGGALVGAALALIFGPALAPLAMVSGALLAWWVRPLEASRALA